MFVAGCNWVFGVHAVVETDAAFYDAPPHTCPAFGTLPEFDTNVQQYLFQNCTQYTSSIRGKRALALCPRPSEGMLGEQLAAAPGLDATNLPRLGADGDLAAALSADDSKVLIFHRDAMTWTPIATLVTGASLMFVSEPSLGPTSHVLVFANGLIHEFVEDSAQTWSDVAQYPLASLAISKIASVHLSTDGLRMWGLGDDRLMYADRADLGDPFTPRAPLNIAFVGDGFLSEDCSRFYFSALQSVWYAPAK